MSFNLCNQHVMARMHVKYCFLLSAMLSTSAGLNILMKYEETLPVEKRRKMDSQILKDIQPFSFVQVMTKSPALAKLMLVTGLQTASEGRNVESVFSIFMRQDLKWDSSQVNNFVGALGLALVLGGATVKVMMKKFGLFHFTTVSNVANSISHLCYYPVNPQLMYLGLLFGMAGGRKRDAIESMVMKVGLKEGFGGGFLSGALMNWRAITNMVGPLVVGSIYVYGRRQGKPGLIMLVLAATSMLAEMVHQTITCEEVGVDKQGAFIEEKKTPVGNVGRVVSHGPRFK